MKKYMDNRNFIKLEFGKSKIGVFHDRARDLDTFFTIPLRCMVKNTRSDGLNRQTE